MLVETALEIGHLCVELSEVLLLLGHQREHGANKLPDGHGRGSPVLRRNPRRWWRAFHVHRRRIPGSGAFVKRPGSSN
jgi:hypothetical protein